MLLKKILVTVLEIIKNLKILFILKIKAINYKILNIEKGKILII